MPPAALIPSASFTNHLNRCLLQRSGRGRSIEGLVRQSEREPGDKRTDQARIAVPENGGCDPTEYQVQWPALTRLFVELVASGGTRPYLTQRHPLE
jgi:hypothetical protein